MKIVITSGGKAPSRKLLIEELKGNSYLICADSGANCLHKYNIVPNMLVGDFDSIDKDVFEYFKNSDAKIVKYPSEKDYTDTEIALNMALDMKPDEIVLLGCTGTRMDHFLANLGLLLKCLENKVVAFIKDEHNTIMITKKSLNIYGKKGKTFSLAAYYNSVENLSISGAKYPLNNFYLNIGNPITTSNEFLDHEVKISFDKGNLLIIYPRD